MINKSKSVKDSFAYSVLAVEDEIKKKKTSVLTQGLLLECSRLNDHGIIF